MDPITLLLGAIGPILAPILTGSAGAGLLDSLTGLS